MDPFLLSHGVRDNLALFSIGPGVTPPSLRDQMIRGHLLVTKAKEANRISRSKPLLIVGAGLGGAVAALTAANLNIPTTIIDRAPEPINLQLGCYSRVLCPSQYDWPCSHWSNGALPWSSGIPLVWREGLAAVIAIDLGREFALSVAHTNLDFRNNTTLDDGERLDLRYWDVDDRGNFRINFFTSTTSALDPNGPYQFGAVIACVGQGDEQCLIDPYLGFRFWELDPYSEPGMLLEGTPKVFISGGGDGALQDFLRITTRRATAKEIYLLLPSRVRDDAEQAIFTSEDNHQRTQIWYDKTSQCEIHRAIHRHYEQVVDQLLAKRWRAIDKSLKKLIEHLTPDSEVKLSCPCDHFSNYYGLNRFLVLLLARYVEKKTGKSVISPNRRTSRVEGVFHACERKPWECHGKDHRVFSRPHACQAPGDPVTEDGIYNIVILRHGPAPNSTRSFFGDDVVERRQLLPYYL